MESHGVEVIDLNLDECKQLMSDFIQNNPTLWNEDIGKIVRLTTWLLASVMQAPQPPKIGGRRAF
jgi:hypothetical protein